jgi:hypothetical protein
MLDSYGHESLQEFPSSEWVEAGDGFVEDQQLGPLGDGQGERKLGPLPARERARLLSAVEPETLDALLGQRPVPRRVDPGPDVQVVGDRHGGIDPGVLGDEVNTDKLLGAFGGGVTEHRNGAGARFEQADGQVQSVVLPAPFGPTRPTTLPVGIDRVHSDRTRRRPYRLVSPAISMAGLTLRLLQRRTERCPERAPRCSPRRGRRDGLLPASRAVLDEAGRVRQATRRSRWQ